jgi:hypothetical protein
LRIPRADLPQEHVTGPICRRKQFSISRKCDTVDIRVLAPYFGKRSSYLVIDHAPDSCTSLVPSKASRQKLPVRRKGDILDSIRNRASPATLDRCIARVLEKQEKREAQL